MNDVSIATLRRRYQDGARPGDVIGELLERAAGYSGHNIWIHRLDESELQPYLSALAEKDPASHPLWGIPFAIKDNIDLAGVDTTAACAAYAYRPQHSATVVQRLIDAGAIPLGKTNLDQFATGLNGTRSPWGACANAFDATRISGGSSSGSAVAVALGLASFSLGTDTAGSGRVPAAFNNLVGLKPTRGLLSTGGVVPACRSLDCVSIFALSTDDADRVFEVAAGRDAEDPYSRSNPFANNARHYGRWDGALRLGVLEDAALEFFGADDYRDAYRRTLARLADDGAEFFHIDYAPFLEAARLLYEGPWVAERYLATRPLIEQQPEALLDVIRAIIEPGARPAASELFSAQYRLQALAGRCNAQLADIDALLLPTAPRTFTIAEMQADPVQRNSQLGYYTNFVNLLDLSALAVPALFAADELPFGVTLIGPACADRSLLSIGNRMQQLLGLPLGATGVALPPLQARPVSAATYIDVVVCGAHLRGQPLNWQLGERGARFVAATRTAAVYRLYALAGGPPYRPGLVLDESAGAAIEVEVWSVPAAEFGSFVAGIPAPLGIGKVLLADGSERSGFICEPRGLQGATEITALGGWLAYLKTLA